MESIEEIAIQKYQKNLEYFSKHHNDLAHKLNMFNASLENGSYTAKYDLEYLKDYFDVKELKSNHYLYSANSKEVSAELTKLVNLNKNSYTFEGFPIYNFSDETLANLDEKTGALEGIYPIMNYYFENTTQDDIMKKIEKFIFIGTGLGMQIPLVHEKIGAKIYLIIEDDIELFRLSLFTTSYFELSINSKLFFSVSDNDNAFLNTMALFLDNAFIHNRYLKYSYFPAHSEHKIKLIQSILASQSFVLFPYKFELKKLLKPLEYINDDYNVLDLSKHFKDSVFSKKPVLLVAAGPSLQKNIKWLKQNHKKFIIIALSSTLNTLFKNGIRPDILTHIDPLQTSLIHFKDLPLEDFLKSTIVILGPFSPSNLRDFFKKEQVYYYEENTNYFDGFGSITAPCLGSFSLLLSIILDVKELYLLGLDLALDQETGATHSSDHFYNDKSDMSKKERLEKTISARGNLFPVQGNFTKTVYTTPLFYQSIQLLYSSIEQTKLDNQNIYNLNDGASINKTTPKKVEDINIKEHEDIDKEELFALMQDSLSDHSRKELSQADIISLKQRLENAKKIKSTLLDYSKNVSYAETPNYINNLIETVSQILRYRDRESNNLTHIYYHFFKYALPIFIDLLNNSALKDEKKHIEKIDKILQDEMFIIQNTYELALEEFITQRC